MYGFHKIKNDCGFHEFRHTHFKRGCYEDLVHIKRKNFVFERENEEQNKDADCEELFKLKDKLDTTKTSLESVTRQNMLLISNNKEVASQLYAFKQEYEQKLSKFFFMFYFIINSKNESLLNVLKKALADLDIVYEDNPSKSVEQRTLDAYNYINNEVLANNNYDHAIINKLLNAFTFYCNTEDNYVVQPSEHVPALNVSDAYKQRRCTFLSTEAPDMNLHADESSKRLSELSSQMNSARGEALDHGEYIEEEWGLGHQYEDNLEEACDNSCFDEMGSL